MWGWSIIASARRSIAKRSSTSRLRTPGRTDSESDRALQRLSCLREIDTAHRPFAEQSQGAVGAIGLFDRGGRDRRLRAVIAS